MPEFGDIQRAPDGGLYKLGDQGWQPISEEQARLELAGPGERFALGMLGGPTAGTAGALGNLAGIGLAVGPLAAAGVRGAGRALGRRTVAQRVQQAAQQSRDRFARDLGDIVRGPDPGVGRRAAGAAADQLQAMAESTPLVRAMVALPAARRQTALNTAVAESLGLGGEVSAGGALTRKTFGPAMDAADKARWAAVMPKGAKAEAATLNAQQLGDLREIAGLGRTTRAKIADATDSLTVTAGELRDIAKQAGKQAARGETNAAREIARDVLDWTDELVKQSDAVVYDLWKQANAVHRVQIALESGQAWKAGNVNFQSFRSALQRVFKRQYSRQRLDGIEEYAPDVARLLRDVDELEAMGTKIGTSGTSERSGGLFGPFAGAAVGVGLFGE